MREFPIPIAQFLPSPVCPARGARCLRWCRTTSSGRRAATRRGLRWSTGARPSPCRAAEATGPRTAARAWLLGSETCRLGSVSPGARAPASGRGARCGRPPAERAQQARRCASSRRAEARRPQAGPWPLAASFQRPWQSTPLEAPAWTPEPRLPWENPQKSAFAVRRCASWALQTGNRTCRKECADFCCSPRMSGRHEGAWRFCWWRTLPARNPFGWATQSKPAIDLPVVATVARAEPRDRSSTRPPLPARPCQVRARETAVVGRQLGQRVVSLRPKWKASAPETTTLTRHRFAASSPLRPRLRQTRLLANAGLLRVRGVAAQAGQQTQAQPLRLQGFLPTGALVLPMPLSPVMRGNGRREAGEAP